MDTPSPKYFCPRCRAVYGASQKYCGRCGANMQRASGLQYAEQTERMRLRRKAVTGQTTTELDAEWVEPEMDRRAAHGRDEWLGQLVDSRYRVREVLGRGGMGVVYKVEHQNMGKIAAMKVLHHELAEDPEVVFRFRREAAAVSRLNHPNTVQVFDFGTARGALYLIMEYVRGTDLGTLIKRDGPLRFDRAAPLFGQICAALAEAHDLGIVHRDLKPENVLLTRTHGGRDFVKVLDFGLAKLSERDELPESTDHGAIIGTPYYMSPEQIRGDDVDARSDIYSLGALMYRVLTAEHPFTAKTPVGVLTKHLTADLVPPSQRCPELQIDERVDAVVGRAMAKRPEARYPDANSLLADLEAAYSAISGTSPSQGLPGLSTGFGGGSTSVPAAAERLLEDDIDYGMDSDARLRRSDIDAYERSMLRRRRLGVALIPTILVLAAAAIVYLVMTRKPTPRTSEAEPNNDIDQATLIEAGTEVTGLIGKRLSKRAGDRDYYRVAGSPPPDSTVTLHVTALPNIDLDLSLYEPTGKLLAQRDEEGVGRGEWIRSYRVTAPVIVKVGQSLPGGPRLPVENVSDHYTLTVTYAPITPGVEVEPDDNASDAMALGSATAVTGYLDRREDTDFYVFRGKAGRHELRISGAGAVPIVWSHGSGPARTERSAELELAPGDTIELRRGDQDVPADRALPGADEPYAIQLRRLP